MNSEDCHFRSQFINYQFQNIVFQDDGSTTTSTEGTTTGKRSITDVYYMIILEFSSDVRQVDTLKLGCVVLNA